MIKRTKSYTSGNPRHGYTVIIVLLILTILALLAITLSYTTRLETVSASNYSSGIQARTAAVTGVAAMGAKLSPYSSVDAPMMASNRNFWSASRASQATADVVHVRSGERSQFEFDVDVPPVSDLYTEDTSAQLNLNTATVEQMTLVFQAALNKQGMPYSQAADLAKSLANWRLGPDGRPGRGGVDDDADAGLVSLTRQSILGGTLLDPRGARLQSAPLLTTGDKFDNDLDGDVDEPDEQIDEPDEYIADIRRDAFGDDRRVFVLSDLNYVPGFTPEVIDAIRPYVTVFSESKDVYIDKFNKELPRLNVNYAGLDEMFEVMADQFPDKDTELLAQFVVNVADYRDDDSIPTVHTFELNGRKTTVFGFEVTPFINEVWPDSISSDDREDDDGQYVEIINPWTVPINVDGWKLKTATSDVVLKGSIAPRGFLIITDDLDDTADDTPEDDEELEFGSFYDIFGLVPNGNNFRMVEHSAFDLPNDKDTVRLFDRTGQLIDEFEYEADGSEQFKYSWQRSDPRLRASRLESCTPYMVSRGFSALMEEFDADPARDQLFHSLADVLNVSASYVRQEPGGRQYAESGRYPLFEKAEGAGHLDWSLLDGLTIDSDLPSNSPWHLSNLEYPLTPLATTERRKEKTASLLGRVNVNTASPELLKFMFNLDIEALIVEDGRETDDMTYRHISLELPGDQGRQIVRRAVFKNRSDFLAAVLGEQASRHPSRRTVIEAAGAILPQITFGSTSYSVLSQNRMLADTTGERAQARSLIKAIVSLDDDGQTRIINWHFVH